MKRLTTILILLAIFTLSSAAEDVTSLAVILKTVGSVEYHGAQADGWTPVSQGQVVASGDRLRTGTGGELALLFVSDKSLLKLAEETEITLRAGKEGDTVSTRIWMDVGDLWAKVTKKDDPHFEVETPTSVASVKGSEFYCLEDPATGNILHALTGRYSYANEHGMIELGAKMTGISDGRTPPRSYPTRGGEVPDFGGVSGYGELEDDGSRVIRIEFENENGEARTLVIPIDQPE